MIALPTRMAINSPIVETLRARLADVRKRVDTAARRCGRGDNDVRLIAISKTHPVEILQAAIAAGITELGENRVQEAEEKILQLGRTAARWHLVGHLQKNKVRRAVKLFDYIHSLDSSELAVRLNEYCDTEHRDELPVLIQVDLGGEATKSGIATQHMSSLLERVANCSRLRLVGLMTLPPFFENPDCARPFFRTLRELRDDLQRQGIFGSGQGELSMGMSHDFEIAIEEGATMVRVGTAIFGDRK